MAESKTAKDIQEGKFFAVISYISFLCVVALVLKKDNHFALQHAKQGLVLFVFEALALIISVIPLLGVLIKVPGFLVFGFLSLWGIVQALLGNECRLPIISDIADKIVL